MIAYCGALDMGYVESSCSMTWTVILIVLKYPTSSTHGSVLNHPQRRGGFTARLMTFKLQGPLLAGAPSEALGGHLAFP
jgi:hypothetical protein